MGMACAAVQTCHLPWPGGWGAAALPVHRLWLTATYGRAQLAGWDHNTIRCVGNVNVSNSENVWAPEKVWDQLPRKKGW